jgi:hypothetical protein
MFKEYKRISKNTKKYKRMNILMNILKDFVKHALLEGICIIIKELNSYNGAQAEEVCF